ncbi:hypothetical protein PC118_g9123 [Phytophthora cactorum]|uniref:MULE transposase domain-containing protein n=1 Tax=Phytophthora cactorum TaxID=29920 RepID=A0A329S624_9STRA|nr:hypothetical protein PC112_g9098 [Phytophthora cactorum]KAG2827902.1 hypothetical protein PC111_g8383 [Phytophthora cactorum]KAG2858715.1 hypothetical protein PC113_g9569 [Phytophthora cactorum]KAG2923924.1 hypothetical protein PC115_g8793 [Phytophthora cactorum]KAG2983959.1 hypothetical protein PC118_g9123 [Phytophthora cactorum]
MRNTTQELQRMTTLVMTDMLQMHNRTTTTLTGAAIHRFLLGKGFNLVRSAISRMKLDIEDRLRGDIVDSYQKFKSYFQLMTGKNPGSVWRLDKKDDDLTFKRACFITNLGIHVMQMCKGLIGFDGAHLKGEMNKRGVFLVATTKDYNNHVVPFALGLVSTENYENWRWFMDIVKFATGLENLQLCQIARRVSYRLCPKCSH